MTFCLIGFAVTKARALQPPAVGEVERLQQQGVWDKHLAHAKALGNDKMAPELVQRAASKVFRARLESYGLTKSEVDAVSPLPPLALRGLPTTGSPKMLTVLLSFKDYPAPAAPTAATIALNTYGAGSAAALAFAPLESLNRYYFRASEGLLNIGGNALPWYPLPNNRATYEPTAGMSDEEAIFNMLKLAMQANVATHDFSQYDNDNDGDIDVVNIIWTGPKGAWASFWWGYKSSFEDVNDATTTQFDGKTVKEFTWQWLATRGSSNTDYDPQVIIHETGHSLGVPDYYDYLPGVGPDGGVGGLDMMDANQGNFNAFSRWMLDWISPTIVGSGSPAVRTLNASGDTSLVGNKAVVVFPNASSSPFAEFFMVENRQRVGNDTVNAAIPAYPYQMPSDGLLIWHVDGTLGSGGTDFAFNNSFSSHKLLRLMEADGLEEIEQQLGGDAGDYYNTGGTFTPMTTPDSYAYDGSDTSVTVETISAIGSVMTANIGFQGVATVAKPFFNPPAGNYITPVAVTIQCVTPGATIYYTTDGTTPTTSSTVYTGVPISLATDTTLKAFATLAGYNDSPVASAKYHFYVDTPVLNPNGGIFDAPIAVTISCATLGAAIHYTTNGTIPDASSPLYTAPIPLSTDTTLNVYAIRAGFRDSLCPSAFYQFVSAQTLADNVAKTGLSGAIGSRQYFKIDVPTGQAKIMFKTSGGTGDCDMYVRFGTPPLLDAWDYRPARLGNAETVTVNVPTPGTWYVMLHGYKAYSGVSLLADYSLPSGTVATPVIKPAGGTYYSPVNVSITCGTSGASIRWTSDGSAPTASSPLYTGPIKISSTATVQARAFKSGLYDSSIASATYTIGTSPTTPTVITDGVAVTGLTGAAGSMLFYKITVPAGQTKLDIKTYGGTGDCDLYVRYGSSPTLRNWNYRPARIGNNETVSINAPAAGDWYIMIYGYKSYSGVSLLGDYY